MIVLSWSVRVVRVAGGSEYSELCICCDGKEMRWPWFGIVLGVMWNILMAD